MAVNVMNETASDQNVETTLINTFLVRSNAGLPHRDSFVCPGEK